MVQEDAGPQRSATISSGWSVTFETDKITGTVDQVYMTGNYSGVDSPSRRRCKGSINFKAFNFKNNDAQGDVKGYGLRVAGYGLRVFRFRILDLGFRIEKLERVSSALQALLILFF